ncbi:MAG: DUF354 domain-containing protein [Halobacteriota archaeon]
MKRIWIDYMAPCDVFFFKSLLKERMNERKYEFYSTARIHAETADLLKDNGIEAELIGKHDVSSSASQICSFIERNFKLALHLPKFDVSLSLANIYGIIVSKLRLRPSISIIDNDLIEYERTLMEKIAAKVHARADWIIAPAAYPVDLTISKGANPEKVFTFNGYKEDIYIADYEPDPNFLKKIPFEDFVVIRPEALYSTYVHEGVSMTGALLDKFSKENTNVIYLPRERQDLEYLRSVKDRSKIWMPPKPLNGLDLVFHSKAILTGSGTFAREAACMGKTAISFFPDKLLAVDKRLVEEGGMFHSRDVDVIVEYVLSRFNTTAAPTFEKSKKAKTEFLKILLEILEEEVNKND